jgi:hypothetical protein
VGSGEVSPELTALYRRVVKRVHPDLAVDEQDRLRCETLTLQANLAYERRDEAALRAVLQPPCLEVPQGALEAIQALTELSNLGAAIRERREARKAKEEADEQPRERELELLRATSMDPYYVNYRREQEFEAKMAQTWQQHSRWSEDVYDEENNAHAAWAAFFMIACGELLIAKAFNFDIAPMWDVVGLVLLFGGSIAVRINTWINADRRLQQAREEIRHIDQGSYWKKF